MKLLSNLYILLLIASISCTGNDEIQTINHQTKTFSKISHDVLNGSRLNVSDSLSTPYHGVIIDYENESNLYGIISDSDHNPSLHLINLTKDKYIAGTGREGSGPNEFRTGMALYYNNDEGLSVLDPNNLRLTHYKLTNIEGKRDTDIDFNLTKIINLKVNGLPLDFLHLQDGKYISIGPLRTSENKKFAVLDSTGEEIDYIGKFSNFSEKLPPNVNQLAWRAYGAASFDRHKFAVGYYHVDLLEIYKSNGELVEAIRGPDLSNLEFQIQGERFTLSDNTKLAYLSLASSKQFLYTLYSGKIVNEPNRQYGRIILVFDWNGNLIRSFSLDRDAFGISVDKNDKYLISTTHYPEPGVYKYNIE